MSILGFPRIKYIIYKYKYTPNFYIYRMNIRTLENINKIKMEDTSNINGSWGYTFDCYDTKGYNKKLHSSYPCVPYMKH